MGIYRRPSRLSEALEALAEARPVIGAGGTDYYPARVGRPPDGDVLDISGLDELRRIQQQGAHWRIPALATWTDVVEADLPSYFDGLKRAAREIGGVQIRNAGTVCGNLCNASPAADGIPPLLSLDAEVELASRRGTRRLPVSAFVTGNPQTARAPDELVTAVLVPRPNHPVRATFLKLGARKYLVISIVMVAGVIEAEGGLGWVNEELQRDLRLATEPELKKLFTDCATGAIPALSEAYGLEVIWDDQLKHASDIYIEAGDHEHLIHLKGTDFRQLMDKLPHSVISAGKEYSRWVYE